MRDIFTIFKLLIMSVFFVAIVIFTMGILIVPFLICLLITLALSIPIIMVIRRKYEGINIKPNITIDTDLIEVKWKNIEYTTVIGTVLSIYFLICSVITMYIFVLMEPNLTIYPFILPGVISIICIGTGSIFYSRNKIMTNEFRGYYEFELMGHPDYAIMKLWTEENANSKVERTLKFPGIGWVDTYKLEDNKEILIWEDVNLDRFVLIIGPIMDKGSKEIMRKVTLQFIKQIEHYLKSHES